MIARACNLHVFAAGLPANLSAIFLSIRHFAPARDMCAFICSVVFHCVISYPIYLGLLKLNTAQRLSEFLLTAALF